MGAGGTANTNAQSWSGGNTTITRVAGGITITGYGGYGGFKSGQGGDTPGYFTGGGIGPAISTSTSLTTSHSAGGGGGAGSAGGAGAADSGGSGGGGRTQCITGSRGENIPR